MTNYSEKICEACQPDADPATNEEIVEFLSNSPDWSLIQSDKAKKIERVYKFKNFRDALEFTNLVGEVAESESCPLGLRHTTYYRGRNEKNPSKTKHTRS